MFSSVCCKHMWFLLSVIFPHGQAVIPNSSYLVKGMEPRYYPTLNLLIPGPGSGVVRDVVEIIQSMSRPIVLTAFLCWKIDDAIVLSRGLFDGGGVPVHLTAATSLPPSPCPAEAHHTVFLLDLRCEGARALLSKAEEGLLLKAPYTWLLLENTANTSHQLQNWRNRTATSEIPTETHLSVPAELEEVSIMPDSNVLVVSYVDSAGARSIYSVYRAREGGAWLREAELRGPAAPRRMDVRGAPIRVCFVVTDNDTIHHLTDYKNKHIDTITKVNFVLTNHVIDIINGSREISFENSWGYRDDAGSWSGMLGQLTTNRADIGGSPLFVTSDRVSVIDYIAMPTPTRSKFVFRQPKLSYMSNVFLLPFRGPVWACSAALLLTLAGVLHGATRWERRHAPAASDLLSPSWSDVAVMTVGALCQQGSSVQLKGVVGRLVILLMFLSLMFLYTSYSANIVALLQSSSSRIHSLPDLLNSRLKFAVHDTVFNRYYFSTATEPVRKAIYQKKIAPPGVSPRFISLDEGVKKLRQGLFAFHMEIGVGYQVVEEIFLENEKCGLQEIQFLQVVDPWLAVQKNSSYKEMFKIGFRRLQESGLQFRENWLMYTRKPRCSGSNTNFVSVGLVDCMPALLILAYGVLSAALLLIIENAIVYRMEFSTTLFQVFRRFKPDSVDQ